MATLVLDLDRRARLDVDEADVPRELDEGGAVEPLVVDAFRLGAVECAVLGVEVGSAIRPPGRSKRRTAASAAAVSLM